ncbi:MAG: glycerol-3-phosphate acyltransferase [Ignavibacteriae bacterium]|nr:glycerol-3-phosphate acyltransferase [Ignavibacteriota bacterium]
MQNIYLIIFLSLLFYLIGSIPTAFILMKLLHKKDITKEGSGNVGAMNSYDVSGSKKTGVLVFIIDLLKGLIPAVILIYFLKLSFQVYYIPLVALVMGHNFSIWLKFKGGRGLATATGIFAVVNFWIVVIWCVVFLLSQFFKKNVHIGNALATILLPFMLLILNSQELMCISCKGAEFSDFMIFISLISLIILLKHINPIKNLITKTAK